MTGERKKEKEAKTATARTLWVPAVNNHGGFGRWAFLEITDPYDNCADLIPGAFLIDLLPLRESFFILITSNLLPSYFSESLPSLLLFLIIFFVPG